MMDKIIRKRRMISKSMKVLFISMVILLCGCLGFGTFLVSAHEEEENPVHRYYKSIEIQAGDTLWDIAEETMTSEYDSVNEYVEVLKEMNGLDSDDIEAGQYLIIAYDQKRPDK